MYRAFASQEQGHGFDSSAPSKKEKRVHKTSTDTDFLNHLSCDRKTLLCITVSFSFLKTSFRKFVLCSSNHNQKWCLVVLTN